MLLFLYTKALMLLHAAYFRAAPATAVKPPLSRCVFVRYSQLKIACPITLRSDSGGYLALYTKAPYRRPSTVQRKSAFTLADRSTVVGGPGACHSRDRKSGEIYLGCSDSVCA